MSIEEATETVSSMCQKITRGNRKDLQRKNGIAIVGVPKTIDKLIVFSE